MDISVIGNGRWGSFLAWYAAGAGHDVLLYGRKDSPRTRQFYETRQNALLTLPEKVALTTDLGQALQRRVVLVSVASQSLRGLLGEMAAAGAGGNLLVLCMKGLETGTGKRLSQIVAEELGTAAHCAVWLGPGHVQDYLAGVPNCMVIDSADEREKSELVEMFQSDLIRFYYGEDLIGNEVGAAAKNVVGIAAGMLDGYGLSSLKGALMSRGCREYARLIMALGGSELSAYGLCHLGDYEATVFSRHSQNRAFGECFVKGQPFEKLAEGYYTAAALMTLADEKGVELPITKQVYQVLYQKKPPRQALEELFDRSLKQEFAR